MTKSVGVDWKEKAFFFPPTGINFKSISDKVAL